MRPVVHCLMGSWSFISEAKNCSGVCVVGVFLSRFIARRDSGTPADLVLIGSLSCTGL